MGMIHGTVQLSNPTRPELQGLEERALSDGHRHTVPYMGPIEVSFANRRGFTGAMVLGNAVFLGANPTQDMVLELRPR